MIQKKKMSKKHLINKEKDSNLINKEEENSLFIPYKVDMKNNINHLHKNNSNNNSELKIEKINLSDKLILKDDFKKYAQNQNKIL